MAYEEKLDCITVEAGQDLSAKQYYFMTIAADGQIDPTGDGAKTDVILQNKPIAAGEASTLGISGVSKCVAGATVTAGDDIAVDSAGKGVPATTTGDIVAGRALTGAASGAIFSILLRPQIASPA